MIRGKRRQIGANHQRGLAPACEEICEPVLEPFAETVAALRNQEQSTARQEREFGFGRHGRE